ncbi:hypothetical protein U4E84_03900 [Halorubrum sp. AD140]|uniref:hypothetical protein n=1 Tax=Halorubrum sp. AD140 TaxID=3050073 RepID=UPI002ACCD950|nr:hypothetical protein [Halorubrum sp. AD140]MDZ5810495.1 hypothetical protein [Halorubrum sp. AD140]
MNDPGFRQMHDTVSPVLGGGWDKNLPKFEDIFPYDAFEDHFDRGVPWDETSMPAFVERLLNVGKTWGGCSTVEEIDERYRELDRLYEQIKNNGYRTQRDLMQTDDDTALSPLGESWDEPEAYEIVVDIGRDGELIFEDGRHRLAIAKLLDLDKIPVSVLVRHEDWQRVRSMVAHRPESYEEISHPDLQLTREQSQAEH